MQKNNKNKLQTDFIMLAAFAFLFVSLFSVSSVVADQIIIDYGLPSGGCVVDSDCSTNLCVSNTCVNCAVDVDCNRTTNYCSAGICATAPLPDCTPGNTRSCYSGIGGTENVGICSNGTQTCNSSGKWAPACLGQILPGVESCNGVDDDCNGTVDDGCSCTSGTSQSCGPTVEVGICKKGVQNCTGGAWGACVGAINPQSEICGNGIDETCSGADVPCPECTSDSQCSSGQCVRGSCISVFYSDRKTSTGSVVTPGQIVTEQIQQSTIIPSFILKTFGVATETNVKSCEIGLSCTTSDDCYDSQCFSGTCACCIQTCIRTADCCGGYCDSGRCKIPPTMAPFIIRKPTFSGCTGLIQECLPGDKGCLSICNAMTFLFAIVSAGTLFAFWKTYKHPVIAVAGTAIPIVIAVITYPFAGVIVSMLLIGLLFAK